jgi:hypothetical protein
VSAYHAISNVNIIKAGGSVTVAVNGYTHRIRSDFPVNLTFNDGSSRIVFGSDSEAFQPNTAGGWFILCKQLSTITLTLPAGFGGSGVPLTQAKGHYGLCVIETEERYRGGNGESSEPWPIDPRLLSTHAYQFYEDTGIEQVGVVQSDHALASWQINGKLPTEFFVTAVSVSMYEVEIQPQGNEQYTLIDGTSRVTCIRQANGTPDEREDLWSVSGMGAYTVPFNYMKMPLAALLAPWASETPTIALEYTENRSDHQKRILNTVITGAVRW